MKKCSKVTLGATNQSGAVSLVRIWIFMTFQYFFMKIQGFFIQNQNGIFFWILFLKNAICSILWFSGFGGSGRKSLASEFGDQPPSSSRLISTINRSIGLRILFTFSKSSELYRKITETVAGDTRKKKNPREKILHLQPDIVRRSLESEI